MSSSAVLVGQMVFKLFDLSSEYSSAFGVTVGSSAVWVDQIVLLLFILAALTSAVWLNITLGNSANWAEQKDFQLFGLSNGYVSCLG